jgi:pantoate--beta-alanine ligase
MKILQNRQEMADLLASWKQQGLRIGVVPTMGNLHAGHLSLLEAISGKADKIITTIYVNPLQFAQGEDFDMYPRTHEADFEKLRAAGSCDAVFIPEQMYKSGHATAISPAGVALGYEAKTRPHFFGGVATIVLKLFQQTGADVAIFGEKDYQQLQVIRQMVRDLDLQVEIIASPTIREADGLAMSSRNGYLAPAERQIAPFLYQAMQEAATEIRQGKEVEACLKRASDNIWTAGFTAIDYLSYCDGDSLAKLETHTQNGMLLAAVYLGNVRLIDQLKV